MLEAPIFIYNALHFGPASGEFGEETLAIRLKATNYWARNEQEIF